MAEPDNKNIEISVPTSPSVIIEVKKQTLTLEEAIRAGDWTKVAQIRAAIAAREVNEQQDVNGDGRVAQRTVAELESSLYTRPVPYAVQGYDDYGHPYYANFGYDKEGNYRNSYGGTIGKDDVYRSAEGGETDLRRGIVTKGKNFYNDQTGETLVYNEETKTYTLALMEGGKPKIIREGLTEAQALQEKQRWHDTNREATDAEMAELRKKSQEQDKARPAPGSTTSPDQAPGAAPPPPPPPPSSSSSSPSPSPSPTPSPSPSKQPSDFIGHALEGAVAGIAETHADNAIDAVRTEIKRKRALGLTARGEATRIVDDSRQESMGLQAPKESISPLVSAARSIGLQSMNTQKFRFDRIPKYTKGEAAKPKTFGKAWAKDKNGGIWDAKGGYYDSKGGYYDTQGGYFDKDGHYTDQYGGFLSKQGTYVDPRGNIVDTEGNLWLPGDKDKPSFPKKKGVNYIDILAKAYEGRFNELQKDNPSLTAQDVQKLTASLKPQYVTKDAGGPEKESSQAPQSQFFAQNIAGAAAVIGAGVLKRPEPLLPEQPKSKSNKGVTPGG
jgi:hypothetical protein